MANHAKERSTQPYDRRGETAFVGNMKRWVLSSGNVRRFSG